MVVVEPGVITNELNRHLAEGLLRRLSFKQRKLLYRRKRGENAGGARAIKYG